MEFDVIFEAFTGGRDATYELDLIELGTTPALHLFHGDDFAVEWPA
jgi:hypothetical protein